MRSVPARIRCLGRDSDGDDNDASINPGATEVANDGIDQDCDDSERVTIIYTGDALPLVKHFSCISCHASQSAGG